MKHLVHFAFVSVLLLPMGCALFLPDETRYLQSAQNRATQEEVRQRLGSPEFTTSTMAGTPIWVYQVYEIAPGGLDTWSTRGSWCDEYVLTFDRQGILRQWTHQSQVHGGELMPTYCIWDRFQPDVWSVMPVLR
ncbi:MAG: hypothetical protein ACREJU_19755 [Nitrospiraceae bacterium]